jgi:hypothetical protein
MPWPSTGPLKKSGGSMGDPPFSLENEKYHWLVVLTILKNMKVNGKDYPIYEMENHPFMKPPTRSSIYSTFGLIMIDSYVMIWGWVKTY